MKAGSTKALVNEVEFPVSTGLNCKINIVPVSPDMLAARETARISMELRNMGVNTGMIRLADMKLVRTEAAYLIESVENNALLDKMVKTTIYGNPGLFSPKNTQASAETAVKVLNDKGSFVVALKLRQNINMLVLTYRWIAVKFDSEKLPDEFGPDNTQNIAAVTPTVVLGTKESYFFQVKYNHMKACSVSYELTEPGSGEVSADGIYTAPAKEGVYEIRIFCTEKPFICTYAYAIVKKKMITDAEPKE